MQIKILSGVIFALCASLGLGLVVYAQQESASSTASTSATQNYQEENEKLRETLRQGMERLQQKQKALMEWLQDGSERLEADQQQMEMMKRGLDRAHISVRGCYLRSRIQRPIARFNRLK